MSTLPADTLRIHDATGAGFATVHFVLNPDPTKVKGDCIFVIDPEAETSTRSEVRWLSKRRFEKVGEHRFRLDAHGVLTIESGAFKLVLHPEEEILMAAPSLPRVSATWEA